MNELIQLLNDEWMNLKTLEDSSSSSSGESLEEEIVKLTLMVLFNEQLQ